MSKWNREKQPLIYKLSTYNTSQSHTYTHTHANKIKKSRIIIKKWELLLYKRLDKWYFISIMYIKQRMREGVGV
jgi:hypothetical protein